MKIFGVTLVRSEADIIALTIRYHLQLGLDRVLVLDNGSSDGTNEILASLAQADNRIQWRRHDGEFQQAELITGLAQEAFRAGADWIVPFDADEFWHAPLRPFREVLATTDAGALRAQVINYIQRREHLKRTPEALLTMTRRAPRVIGPPDRGRSLVEAREIAYVEAMYPLKWICRASASLEFDPGYHSAKNLERGPETTLELVCLHAPIRSRDTLLQKAAQSLRLKAAGRPPDDGWHIHRVWSLLEGDLLEEEWAANSYANEALDVYGVRRPVMPDTTLRDAVVSLIATAPGGPGEEAAAPLTEAQWMIAQTASVENLLTNLHDDALARTAWAVDLNEQLVRARERLAELETQVADRTAWAGKLDEELHRVRAHVSDLERRVAERTSWAQSLENELRAAREQIVQLQARVTERTHWAQTANAERARAGSALTALHSEFGKRTAWVVQLQQDLNEQLVRARERLAELETQVVDRTAWAGKLDEELHGTRAIASDLERRVAERTSWAQSLENELCAAREEIVKLQAQVAERTHWAQSLENELCAAREEVVKLQARVVERTHWAQTANAERARACSALATLQSEFEKRTAWALQLQQEVENMRAANARSHLAIAGSSE